jgi:hypothetical protein
MTPTQIIEGINARYRGRIVRGQVVDHVELTLDTIGPESETRIILTAWFAERPMPGNPCPAAKLLWSLSNGGVPRSATVLLTDDELAEVAGDAEDDPVEYGRWRLEDEIEVEA